MDIINMSNMDDFKFFNEEAISDLLYINSHMYGIKDILNIEIWSQVNDITLEESEKGRSNEGQIITGTILNVELILKEKVSYIIADDKNSAFAHYSENLNSMYIILPEEIDGKKTKDLVRGNRISVTPSIEGCIFRRIDETTIHRLAVIFIDVKIF